MDEDDAAVKAKEVGFPVMIKASAGGGGKGMRVAYNEEEVREGFRLSKAEALSSFGDDRMLIERFIEDPHHIEIQVIADSHGNVAAFPERECSVQRRNQKVIEESPSCLLTPETRRKMQEQAIMLCKATNYRSAGTVEMLADGKQNFYFLEMNTRLQVEHPVTEMVSQEDLVEHMLWVASGERLPQRFIDQPFVESKGWAFESRVYAEDPIRNFLPSIGPLVTYKEPETTVHGGASFDQAQGAYDASPDGTVVRVDSGVYEGGEISMYYDPMISKLITHGPDRASSLRAMARALDSYVISGLGNNLTFLRSVVRNEKFARGLYGTKFIEEEYPEGFAGVTLSEREVRRLAAIGTALHWLREGSTSPSNDDDLGSGNNGLRAFNVSLPMGGEQKRERCFAAAVSLDTPSAMDFQDKDADSLDDFGYASGSGGGLKVQLWDLDDFSAFPSDEEEGVNYAGATINIHDLQWRTGASEIHTIMTDDLMEEGSTEETASSKVEAEHGEGESLTYEGRTSGGVMLRYRGARREVVVRSPRGHELSGHMLEPEIKDMSNFLVCPMPGTLISCAVEVGDVVEEGQQLAVVEAMKMQNVLRAEKAGVVHAVTCSPGQHLKVDQVILEFAQK